MSSISLEKVQQCLQMNSYIFFVNKHYLNLKRCLKQDKRPLVHTHKPATKYPENISEAGFKCMLNARSMVNKKNELNVMVEDLDPHIIGLTESWANKDIADAELGLTGYIMFRRNRIGRKGGGV